MTLDLTEDEAWILMQALDDFSNDTAEQASDLEDQGLVADAREINRQATVAARLALRLMHGRTADA